MFYAQEQIGDTRYKTPEGYLLCIGAVISRAGSFPYSKEQAGIDGDEMVTLTRTPEELFSDQTIASFEGKPITIGHEKFVTPENYKQVACGTVLNVRRGEGDKNLMLLADMLICDAKAIESIEGGDTTELSIGFDALVEQDDYGKGHQFSIVGNHVALVPNARCGRVCTFGDEMSISIKNMIRRAFKDGDEDKFNDTLDKLAVLTGKDLQQGDDDGVITEEDQKPNVEQHDEDEAQQEKPSLEERFTALEATVQQLAEAVKAQQADEEEEQKEQADEDEELADEDEEEKVVTADEAEEVFDDAEELTGEDVQRPQCDSADGSFNVDTLRRVKARSLKRAGLFSDSKLSDRDIDIAFKTAVLVARQRRNPMHRGSGFGDSKEQLSGAELLNKINAQYWSTRK